MVPNTTLSIQRSSVLMQTLKKKFQKNLKNEPTADI